MIMLAVRGIRETDLPQTRLVALLAGSASLASALITSAGQVAAFEAGTSNADRILKIRDDIAQLAQLQALAKVQRRIGDAQNGELGWYPPQPGLVDKIIPSADVQTSNDCSVAGLSVAGPFDGLIDIAELAQ